MKKTTVLTLAMTVAFSAQSQAAQLACWNLFSKQGARPTLTAHIDRDDELSDITLNQDPNGAVFNTDGMKNAAIASAITAKTSPYKDQNAFMLADGIRLILPTNLSSQTLGSTSIKGGSNDPRQNGVLDVAGSRYSSEQGGDGFTRMHCTSK